MNKYQNGKIYKLVCDNSPLVYYGSTCQKYLCNRLAKHKYRKNCSSRELFNLGKVTIHLIEDYPCNSKKELEDREKIYIKFILKNFDYKIICNKIIPSRTKEEAEIYNKEKCKNYYYKNKEELKAKANEKFNCPCGGKYTYSSKKKHSKTKKHLKYLEEQKEKEKTPNDILNENNFWAR